MGRGDNIKETDPGVVCGLGCVCIVSLVVYGIWLSVVNLSAHTSNCPEFKVADNDAMLALPTYTSNFQEQDYSVISVTSNATIIDSHPWYTETKKCVVYVLPNGLWCGQVKQLVITPHDNIDIVIYTPLERAPALVELVRYSGRDITYNGHDDSFKWDCKYRQWNKVDK